MIVQYEINGDLAGELEINDGYTPTRRLEALKIIELCAKDFHNSMKDSKYFPCDITLIYKGFKMLTAEVELELNPRFYAYDKGIKNELRNYEL